jgi:hypothetical protein
MRKQLLSLRISRRAIAAAVSDSQGLNITDGQHLRSNTQQATKAAIAFVGRFLDESIAAIAVDRPLHGASTVGDALMQYLAGLAGERRIVLLSIDKATILAAYGVLPLRTRAEVRALVMEYWPHVSKNGRSVTPHVLDAAAAGLHAECALALTPPKT